VITAMSCVLRAVTRLEHCDGYGVNVLQLLETWEREDFADCMMPWMRIERWRFRWVYDDFKWRLANEKND